MFFLNGICLKFRGMSVKRLTINISNISLLHRYHSVLIVIHLVHTLPLLLINLFLLDIHRIEILPLSQTPISLMVLSLPFIELINLIFKHLRSIQGQNFLHSFLLMLLLFDNIVLVVYYYDIVEDVLVWLKVHLLFELSLLEIFILLFHCLNFGFSQLLTHGSVHLVFLEVATVVQSSD